MASDDGSAGPKADEIVEIVREIRERVRSRYPTGMADNVPLPDLLPVLHARDAAEAKVAAIGSVNPRPPGLLNSTIQFCKRVISRLLDWHVRDQVEFNRATIRAFEAVLEALNENNRALSRLAAAITELRGEITELKDAGKIQLLRSVADLEASFTHKASLIETNFRNLVRVQHKDFVTELEHSRLDFERLIHNELRLARQRAAMSPPGSLAPALGQESPFDAMWFAERFRGSAEYVRDRQRFYLPFFKECSRVLDLGCGRGEFLEIMKEAGIEAQGIDRSDECVALCKSKGLNVESADLFAYLGGPVAPEVDGIFAAQIAEHLAPERLPEFIRLASERLSRDGVLAIETPNPECLAIFATHFYLDPSHSRPVPAALLKFYMEEFGFGGIQTHRLSPAAESLSGLASLPPDFRDAFFGGLDYAIIGRKL